MSKARNRKLLTSVYSPQEAREAILGGARIIDSEDPKSALGNISPLRIMAISDATLEYTRDLEIQLSTNIGEDQLIFRRTESGHAVEKSPLETAGKAAQAALGVALSMGTEVHPCNIVKVGLDNMSSSQLEEVLTEVVLTLRRTPPVRRSQVMSVLFAHNLELWNKRKTSESVRRELVNLREFGPAEKGAAEAVDLREYHASFVNPDGSAIFASADAVTVQSLQKAKILPREATGTWVKLNELYPNHPFFCEPESPKTTQKVIEKMVDITARAGADAMMIDTSILSKVCSIGLLNSDSPGLVNLSRFIERDGLVQTGVLSLEDIEFFVEYCHYKGIVANLAGSIESFQAQQLWSLVPTLDQISARGAASATYTNPATGIAAQDNRQRRTIVRQLVRGIAPAESGGVLNVPEGVKKTEEGHGAVLELCKVLSSRRQLDGDPPLDAFYASRDGALTPIPSNSWR
jgi:uncharacterized protein (UPF0264 family)